MKWTAIARLLVANLAQSTSPKTMKPKGPTPRTARQYIQRSRIISFIVLGQLLASAIFALLAQSSAPGLALLVGLTFVWGGLLGTGGGVSIVLMINGAASIMAIVYGVKALKIGKRELDLAAKRSARFALTFASIALTWLLLQIAMTGLIVWAISSAWG